MRAIFKGLFLSKYVQLESYYRVLTHCTFYTFLACFSFILSCTDEHKLLILFTDIDLSGEWVTTEMLNICWKVHRGSRSKDEGTCGGAQCGFFSSCRHYLIPWTLPLHPPQACYMHRSITHICHPLIGKLWKNCASKAITSAVSQGLWAFCLSLSQSLCQNISLSLIGKAV